MVPALPSRNPKVTESHFSKLLKIYTRFLQSILRSEVLKTCKLIVDFLKIENYQDWLLERTKFEKYKFSRQIQDVISESG